MSYNIFPPELLTQLQNYSHLEPEFVLETDKKEISKFNCLFQEDVLSYMVKAFSLPPESVKKIQESFTLCKLGGDFASNRWKLYISLYKDTQEQWIDKIVELQKILWKPLGYEVESNFTEFDCIGVDISPEKVEIKIYELITPTHDSDDIKEEFFYPDVKEFWVMKSPSWRKKYFYRFGTFQELANFKDDFDVNIDDSVLASMLKGRVKYITYEWNKKEIYFV